MKGASPFGILAGVGSETPCPHPLSLACASYEDPVKSEPSAWPTVLSIDNHSDGHCDACCPLCASPEGTDRRPCSCCLAQSSGRPGIFSVIPKGPSQQEILAISICPAMRSCHVLIPVPRGCLSLALGMSHSSCFFHQSTPTTASMGETPSFWLRTTSYARR